MAKLKNTLTNTERKRAKHSNSDIFRNERKGEFLGPISSNVLSLGRFQWKKRINNASLVFHVKFNPVKRY